MPIANGRVGFVPPELARAGTGCPKTAAEKTVSLAPPKSGTTTKKMNTTIPAKANVTPMPPVQITYLASASMILTLLRVTRRFRPVKAAKFWPDV